MNEEVSEALTYSKVDLIPSLIPERGRTTSREISEMLNEWDVKLDPRAVGQLIHHQLLYAEVERERELP